VLERRLNQNAKAAAAAIAGPCPDDQPVVQKVQQVEAAVGQLRQTNMQQLHQWHTEAAAYVQELESIHGLLQQLVGQCMVEDQPKISEVGCAVTQKQLLPAQHGACQSAAAEIPYATRCQCAEQMLRRKVLGLHPIAARGSRWAAQQFG
jgi:hypothetical protein